ncbi:MAG: hypothetical protein MJE68_15045 [Proteobacteria bacterium]|nr:hypothetical protein [Pseudomonadota bacterium]
MDEAKALLCSYSFLIAYFSAFEGGGSPSVRERESAADQIFQCHDHKERHTGTAPLPRLRPPATPTSPMNSSPCSFKLCQSFLTTLTATNHNNITSMFDVTMMG